ncbi:MAG: hypothetical protein RMN53_00065 [Anaerolineae bacterium]|nr:hypothetical protein [Anaerolineae bacterium]
MVRRIVRWIGAAAVALTLAWQPVVAQEVGGTSAADQAPGQAPEPATATSCLYPSAHERFGVTVSGDINRFDVSPLPAAAYMDWSVRRTPAHPNGMYYYPIVYVRPNGYWPSGAELEAAVRNFPGALWMIGNEAETVWMDNVTPDEYARAYHDVTTRIRALDPTAKFAFTSIATVSTLRLAWLDMALEAYRGLYGRDPTVDVWTVHTYEVNEMAQEWGSEIPTGIRNAVGFYGQWTEASVAGASGGTVHQSRTAGDRFYFAFYGGEVTLFLRTGPDSGRAAIYIDHRADPVETVDLYSPTPGAWSKTYRNLTPSPDERLGNRHNIRVQVTGARNPSATDTWVRVDAIAASSTTVLPNGRLENNSPMQARILNGPDDHDNIEKIANQVRRFRQWMADRGQRNKPLINSEYGILMTEDLGFTYERVRTFMLNSFNLFITDLQDPNLGLPADDNRLLQQWLWFALNQDVFEGRVVHTGLYSDATRQIKPLGQEFINYVQPLVRSYVDLEAAHLALTPTWPLFSGEPTLVQMQGIVVNRGNMNSGPLIVRFSEGAQTIQNVSLGNLPKRFDAGYRQLLNHSWRTVVTGDRTVTLTADVNRQTGDNCRDNNVYRATLSYRPQTDLAVTNLRVSPSPLPAVQPGREVVVTLTADIVNLDGSGTAANQVAVQFWQNTPDGDSVLLHTVTLRRGQTTLPVTVSYDWRLRGPGAREFKVTVENVSDDVNLNNNRLSGRLLVPSGSVYFPVTVKRYRTPRLLEADETAVSEAAYRATDAPWLSRAHMLPPVGWPFPSTGPASPSQE